ncbi:MAG TPA: hypothetical protein VGU25_08625 [Acidobacteriaceae bacterium]|nr:hypothetical protein [Acidobacteriaceae bacterium]
MRAWPLFLVTIGSLIPAVAQRVERAYVGSDQQVHIVLHGKPEFVAPKEMRLKDQRIADAEDRQVSVEAPAVAPDGRTVGWIVNFPNCCTSYPIPLTLVIFRDGSIVQRFAGMPIWKFSFEAGGDRVAMYMDTLHGQSAAWCQLRESGSGKLLDEWRLSDHRPIPGWAEPFRTELEAAAK